MKTLNYNQKVIIACIIFAIAFIICPLVIASFKGTISNLNSIGY